MIEKTLFRKISFEIRKLEQSLVSRNKIFQSENSLRKFLSFSLFLWFWAFRETQQCTCSHDKQSASLYIRQDSIDMSAFTHSSTCTLHSDVAIGISCTQSLGVDFSPATPKEALCALCAEYTHAQ